MNLLGVELERVFGELESLLDEGSQLTDAATLLAKNLLGVGGTDDDLFHSSTVRAMLKVYREDDGRTSVRA